MNYWIEQIKKKYEKERKHNLLHRLCVKTLKIKSIYK